MNDITISTIEQEARVYDLDLAAFLGYAQPVNIRKLIKRHAEPLSRMGVISTVEKTPAGGGRPALEFFLNKKQAAYICAKSDTEEAIDRTVQLIEKFDAYERGEISVPQTLPEALRLAADLSEQLEEKEKLIENQKPKVDFVDQFVNSDGLYGLQNAARAISCRPNKFVQWLKQDHMFYQGNSLVPRAQYVQRGLFEVKNTVIDEKARPRSFITPKGIEYFTKKAPDSIRLGDQA